MSATTSPVAIELPPGSFVESAPPTSRKQRTFQDGRPAALAVQELQQLQLQQLLAASGLACSYSHQAEQQQYATTCTPQTWPDQQQQQPEHQHSPAAFQHIRTSSEGGHGEPSYDTTFSDPPLQRASSSSAIAPSASASFSHTPYLTPQPSSAHMTSMAAQLAASSTSPLLRSATTACHQLTDGVPPAASGDISPQHTQWPAGVPACVSDSRELSTVSMPSASDAAGLLARQRSFSSTLPLSEILAYVDLGSGDSMTLPRSEGGAPQRLLGKPLSFGMPSVMSPRGGRMSQGGGPDGFQGPPSTPKPNAPVDASAVTPPSIQPAHMLPPPPPAVAQPLHAPPETLQSFWDYLHAEVQPAEKRPTTDVLWGQTERDKVYNFMLHVPYQLERLIMFGLLLCIDSFLAILTFLPYRCFVVTWRLGRHVTQWGRSSSSGQPLLSGRQVFDLLCCVILAIATYVLRVIKPGIIYYWMKDITTEFLKIGVLSAAFDISDKILNNFGVDVLEALSGTCSQWAVGIKTGPQVAADATVALVIVVLHAVVLMCQGLVLAVAMSSRRHGLLAMLIASNFVEVKGVVFKRWDMPRIYNLVCADIVERFHLMAILMFVAVEDMDSSALLWPSPQMWLDCWTVLGSEVVIDILKHAVLGKMNDVRPGIYREFMKDLCEGSSTAQSYQLPKLLMFHNLGSAALVMRTLATLFWIRSSSASSVGGLGVLDFLARCWSFLLAWATLLLVKPLLGYGCKWIAHHYVAYYNLHYHKLHAPNRSVSSRAGAARAVVVAAPHSAVSITTASAVAAGSTTGPAAAATAGTTSSSQHAKHE